MIEQISEAELSMLNNLEHASPAEINALNSPQHDEQESRSMTLKEKLEAIQELQSQREETISIIDSLSKTLNSRLINGDELRDLKLSIGKLNKKVKALKLKRVK